LDFGFWILKPKISVAYRLSAFLLLASSGASTTFAQCTDLSTPPATIQLITPPFAQFSSRIQLSDFYPTIATIGTAQATISGHHIDVKQTTSLGLSPTITCRVQILDLGLLSPGTYDVTWTTTENLVTIPATQTGIRTLSFVILPAEAIPAADRYIILLIGVRFRS